MKTGILTIIFLLICTIGDAQHIQNGIVLEYNEANAKTPIGGAEIVASGASSAISDAKGAFILDFKTLKAGDATNVRVAKAGYEVFNIEALQHYNLARDKKNRMEIILVNSQKFRKLCQRYYTVSSQSYARQLQKEKDALAAQRNANKIAENEYRKMLADLEADYEAKKRNIAVYAEQFARIDLETVSDNERDIIALVQEGKLDEAIKAYEDINPGAMYVALSKELSTLSRDLLKMEELISMKTKCVGRLYNSMNKQIDLYVEEGGEENLQKAGELMRKAALADTTNIEIVLKYARFAQNNNLVDDAVEFYSIALQQLSENDSAAIDLKATIKEIKERIQE